MLNPGAIIAAVAAVTLLVVAAAGDNGQPYPILQQVASISTTEAYVIRGLDVVVINPADTCGLVGVSASGQTLWVQPAISSCTGGDVITIVVGYGVSTVVVYQSTGVLTVVDALTGVIAGQLTIPKTVSLSTQTALMLNASGLVVFTATNTTTNMQGTIVFDPLTASFVGEVVGCGAGNTIVSFVDLGNVYVQLCENAVISVMVSRDNPAPVVAPQNYTNSYTLSQPGAIASDLSQSLVFVTDASYYNSQMTGFHVNQTTGAVVYLWEYYVNTEYGAQLLVSNNVVFNLPATGCYNCYITALDFNGDFLWDSLQSNPFFIDPTNASRAIYWNGVQVQVIEVSTFTVVAQLPVNTQTITAAVNVTVGSATFIGLVGTSDLSLVNPQTLFVESSVPMPAQVSYPGSFADGQLYVVLDQSNFVIFSSTTSSWALGAGAAVVQGRVSFVASPTSNAIEAVEAAGTVVWRSTAGLSPLPAQNIATFGNDKLLVLEPNAVVSVYDTFTGIKLATLLIPSDCGEEAIHISPSISGFGVNISGDSAYFTAGLRCLFRVTPDLTLHTIRVTTALAGIPLVDADNAAVYVTTLNDGMTVAVPVPSTSAAPHNNNNTATVALITLGVFGSACQLIPSSTLANPGSMGLGLNTILYVLCPGTLTAVDSRSPTTVLWSWAIDGYTAGGAAAGNIYVVANAGICRVNLNASLSTTETDATERAFWCLGNLFTTTGTTFSNPIVSPDGVLMVLIDQKLFAIDAVTGQARWTSSGYVDVSSFVPVGNANCNALSYATDIAAVIIACGGSGNIFLVDALPQSTHSLLASVVPGGADIQTVTWSGGMLLTVAGGVLTATALSPTVVARLNGTHGVTPVAPQYPPTQTAAPGATSAPSATGTTQPTTPTSTFSTLPTQPIYYAVPPPQQLYGLSVAILGTTDIFPNVVFSVRTAQPVTDGDLYVAALNMSGGMSVPLWYAPIQIGRSYETRMHAILCGSTEADAVLAMSSHHNLIALHAGNGSTLWSVFTYEAPCRTIVSVPRTNTSRAMVVCVATTGVSGYDAHNGTLLFQLPFIVQVIWKEFLVRATAHFVRSGTNGAITSAGIAIVTADYLNLLHIPLDNVSATSLVWSKQVAVAKSSGTTYGNFANLPKIGRFTTTVEQSSDVVYAAVINGSMQLDVIAISIRDGATTVIDTFADFGNCLSSWWLMLDTTAGPLAAPTLYFAACTTIYRYTATTATAFSRSVLCEWPNMQSGFSMVSPIGLDRLLVATSDTAAVLTKSSGALQWNASVSGFGISYPLDSCPVVALGPDGAILATSRTSAVTAIAPPLHGTAATGWSVATSSALNVQIPSSISASPSVVSGLVDIVVTGWAQDIPLGAYGAFRVPRVDTPLPAVTTCFSTPVQLFADPLGHLTGLSTLTAPGGGEVVIVEDERNASWATQYGPIYLPSTVERIGDVVVVLRQHAVSILSSSNGTETAFITLDGATCPTPPGVGVLSWVGHAGSGNYVFVLVTDSVCVYSIQLEGAAVVSVSAAVLSVGSPMVTATIVVTVSTASGANTPLALLSATPGIVTCMQLLPTLAVTWSSNALADFSLFGASNNYFEVLPYPAGTPLASQQVVLWTSLGAVGVSLEDGRTLWVQKLQQAPLNNVMITGTADGALFIAGAGAVGKLSIDVTVGVSLQWTVPLPAAIIDVSYQVKWWLLAAVPNTAAVIAVSESFIAAFSTATGAPLWQQTTTLLQFSDWQQPHSISFTGGVNIDQPQLWQPASVVVFTGGSSMVLDITTGNIIGMFDQSSVQMSSAARAFNTSPATMLIQPENNAQQLCTIAVPQLATAAVLPFAASVSVLVPLNYTFAASAPNTTAAPALTTGGVVAMKRWSYSTGTGQTNTNNNIFPVQTMNLNGREVIVLFASTGNDDDVTIQVIDRLTGAIALNIPTAWTSESVCNVTGFAVMEPSYLVLVCAPSTEAYVTFVDIKVFNLVTSGLAATFEHTFRESWMASEMAVSAPFQGLGCLVFNGRSCVCPRLLQNGSFAAVRIRTESENNGISVVHDPIEQQLLVLEQSLYNVKGVINLTAIPLTSTSAAPSSRWKANISVSLGATLILVGSAGSVSAHVAVMYGGTPRDCSGSGSASSSSGSGSSTSASASCNPSDNVFMSIFSSSTGSLVVNANLAENYHSGAWSVWQQSPSVFYCVVSLTYLNTVTAFQLVGTTQHPSTPHLVPVLWTSTSSNAAPIISTNIGVDPITHNATVYSSGLGGYNQVTFEVMALDLQSGLPAFSFQTTFLGNTNTEAPSLTTALVENQTMLIFTSDFYVLAFDVSQRELVGVHTTKNIILTAFTAATQSNRGNTSQRVVGLNVAHGAIEVTQIILDRGYAATGTFPVQLNHFEVIHDGSNPAGSVVVGSVESSVYLWNASGSLLWGTTVHDGTSSSTHVFDPLMVTMPKTGRRVLIKSAEQQTVYAFDAESGALLLTAMLPACDGVIGRSKSGGTAVFDDATSILYVVTGSLCVNLVDVSVLDNIHAMSVVSSSTPVLVQGTAIRVSNVPLLPQPLLMLSACVVVADEYGAVYCLKRADLAATAVWALRTGYTNTGVTAQLFGSTVVLTFADHLAIVDGTAGLILFELPLIACATTIVYNNTLYVVGCTEIIALNLDPNVAASQRALWTTTVASITGSAASQVSAPFIATTGTLVTTFDQYVTGINTQSGAAVFAVPQSAVCTSVTYAADTSSPTSKINAMFIAMCGSEHLYDLNTGLALLQLQSSSKACASPAAMIPTTQLLVSCTSSNYALLQRVPQFILGSVSTVASAPTTPPASYTLAPGFEPQGVATPAPTLPPQADPQSLPDLSCLLNIDALHGPLVSCVNAIGAKYFPNHTVAAGGVTCGALGSELQRCVAAWTSASYCAGSMRYLASVISAWNASASAGLGGFCADSGACVDGPAGSLSVCAALATVTQVPLPAAFVASLPSPANVLPQYEVQLPPAPKPVTPSRSRLSAAEDAGIGIGAALLVLSVAGVVVLRVRSSSPQKGREASPLLTPHPQAAGDIQEQDPPPTPSSSRELASLNGSSANLKYDAV